jgi:hypothetical protein
MKLPLEFMNNFPGEATEAMEAAIDAQTPSILTSISFPVFFKALNIAKPSNTSPPREWM